MLKAGSWARFFFCGCFYLRSYVRVFVLALVGASGWFTWQVKIFDDATVLYEWRKPTSE
jgi:hypothetical protein